MATQLQIRRGTTAQTNSFTGAEGELSVNTTTDTLHVHDGATAGGKALARADGSNIATYAGSFTTLTASGAATLNTLASSGATLTGGTINGVTVGASTPSTGAFTTIAASGAITGNVTGNLTGSILTAAQTNITSVGTLSTLAVTGTVTASKLTVVGADTALAASIGSAAQRVYITPNGTEIIYNASGNAAGHHVWQTGNTERMRIDGATGVVGIGIVPKTWTIDALQIGQNASVSEDANSVYLAANAYANSGWRRTNAQLAGYIRMGTNDGIFSFSNAVTGAADSVITWQERFRIDGATGNVGIGVVPSAAYKMQVNVATNTVSTGSPAASSLFNIAGGTTTVGNGVSLQLSNTSGAKETAWRISAVTTSANNGDLVFNGYAGGADYPERFRIASNGNAIITAPAFHPLTINRGQDIAGHISLEVSGATQAFYGANSSALLRVANSNFTQKMLVDHSGNLTTAGSVNSDRDLKQNIADIPDGSLALIKQLQPRTFNFLESFGFGTKSRTGFIAQEVANVFTTDNRVVTGTDGESNMGVDPLGIIAHLTKAVQEQEATIESQAAAITDLSTRLTALENN